MIEKVRAALAEACQAYSDRRTCLCQLESAALDGTCCHLAGSVLDAQTLAGVVASLRTRLPELTCDLTDVVVLRRPGPPQLVVSTNRTGLYAGPSFLAEMVSELLNGWRLEVLKTQDRWFFVRLEDGYLGWAYRPYLAEDTPSEPTHYVCEPVSLLRDSPDHRARLVTRVPAGTAVVAQDTSCGWLRLGLAGGRGGWAATPDLRALAELPADAASRRAQIVADAFRFVGVPYLWGGCTALGIDCSGFTQLLHRLSGVLLPRDADMQFAAGRMAELPYRSGDLLFFGEGGGRGAATITHVAVSLGGWRIIHSSRSRNGVYEDDVQAVEHLREDFVGARTFLSELRTPVPGPR